MEWTSRFWPAALTVALLPTAADAVKRPQAVFRAGVNYVLVDVIVTDDNDKPVTTLTASDFRIRDGGREQAIVDFERIDVAPARRDVDRRASPAPAADVSSNAPPPHTSRAIVFVIDDGLIRAADLVPLKQLMTSFLRMLSVEDQVAITYVNRSDLGQDFTTDVGLLLAAVDNASEAAGGHAVRGSTTFALKNVVSVLAAARHARKLVVYVSNGSPVFAGLPSRDGTGRLRDATDRLRSADVVTDLLEVFDRARRTGVPIYAVDPHGVASPESVSNLGAISSPEARKARAAIIASSHDFLRAIAENTGGRAFVNQSDLDWAANEIMIENGAYYLLGYYPSPYLADGKFHPIEVSVIRPGLRVRARSGYTTEKPQARAPRLLDSLGSGLPGGELQLRVFAAPVAPTSRGARVNITLDVSYPQMNERTNRGDDQLQIVWVALDPDARIRASGERTLKVPLPDAASAAFTVSVNDLVDMPRGQFTLRVAAASRVAGTNGTVHLLLDVFDFSSGPLQLSPLVVTANADPAVQVAQAGRSRDAVLSPPTTRRSFAATQQIGVFSRVFRSKAAEITMELELRQGLSKIRSIPVQTGASAFAKGAIDCTAAVTLNDLAPGEYVLEMTAKAASGETSSRSVLFRIR